MNATALAALIVAGTSLVTTVLSGYYGRHDRKAQWRRETERPLVAAFLSTSDKCLDAWREAAERKEKWIAALLKTADEQKTAQEAMVKGYAEGWALHEKLRVQLAELDLVAGAEVRHVAANLLSEHTSIRHVIRPAGGANGPSDVVSDYGVKIDTLRTRVVDATRVDIGVDRWAAQRAGRIRLPRK